MKWLEEMGYYEAVAEKTKVATAIIETHENAGVSLSAGYDEVDIVAPGRTLHLHDFSDIKKHEAAVLEVLRRRGPSVVSYALGDLLNKKRST